MATSGISHRVFVHSLKSVKRNYSVLNRLPETTASTQHSISAPSRHGYCHQHQCHHHSYRFHSACVPSAALTARHGDLIHRPLSTSSLHFAEATPSPMAKTDPYKVVAEEMAALPKDICNVLESHVPKMQDMAQYYFGRGKAFRPMVCLLISKLCNHHNKIGDSVLPSQKIVAMVAEMLHTASLIHDDVVDAADERRGIESLNKKFGQRQSILSGNFIHTQASSIISSIGNPRIISLHSGVVEDIICAEFMQLGTKEDEQERFKHYMRKTHKKTASLIATYCKCSAVLANVGENLVDAAYEYGRNLGMSFQFIDDVLDFIVGQEAMGKPTDSDLKLGLANGPVLFAAMEVQDLHPLIMRRFSEPGDVEFAREMIMKSKALDRTRDLATEHIEEAIKQLDKFAPSPARDALAQVPHILFQRKT